LSSLCWVDLPLSEVCNLAGGAASKAASAAGNSVLDALGSWVASGAAWFLDRIGTVLETASEVHLGAPWFTSHERVMVDLGAAFVLPLLVAATIQAILRQDHRIVLRAAFVNLPLALLLTAVAVQLVELALALTDQLSSMVASGSGDALHQALANLEASFARAAVQDNVGVSSFVVFIVASLVVVGAVTLWLELLVRSAAIYVAVLFLPLALASLVWPAISHWARRLTEILAALVLSKFLIVAILSLAAGAVASGTSGSQGMDTALAGAALLLLAAVSPYALLRLVPMAEGALAAEGLRQRAQSSVTTTAAMAYRTAAKAALRAASEAPLPDSVPGTGLGDHYPGPGGTGAGTSPGPSSGPPTAPVATADGARQRPAEDSSGGDGGDSGATAPATPPAAAAERGIPAWRGDPASESVFADALEGSAGRPGHGSTSQWRLGGPPVYGKPWGGVAPDPGGRADVEPGPAGAMPGDGSRRGGRSRHVIDHDDVGPVIRHLPDGLDAIDAIDAGEADRSRGWRDSAEPPPEPGARS
jgi:hypothetical protein